MGHVFIVYMDTSTARTTSFHAILPAAANRMPAIIDCIAMHGKTIDAHAGSSLRINGASHQTL
jgi:hypothetical protein